MISCFAERSSIRVLCLTRYETVGVHFWEEAHKVLFPSAGIKDTYCQCDLSPCWVCQVSLLWSQSPTLPFYTAFFASVALNPVHTHGVGWGDWSLIFYINYLEFFSKEDYLFSLIYLFSQVFLKASGLSCVFPIPLLELAISVSTPGFFYWKMILETKIWVVTNMCLLLQG